VHDDRAQRADLGFGAQLNLTHDSTVAAAGAGRSRHTPVAGPCHRTDVR
jgi:hypothetical protein